MEAHQHTVLITGGATGIGLALARRFAEAGNTVLICGRRAEALAAAQALEPRLHTCVADITDPTDRERLVQWALREHPGLNVLVNNAGVQRRIDLLAGEAAIVGGDVEISTNLTAVLHLTARLLPTLRTRPAAAVVNVGSGLGIVPIAALPVYSATKAALHTYTRCLRHQLRDTSVRVFDLLPPVVATELDQGARQAQQEKTRALSPEAVATVFWRAWLTNREVVPVGLVRLLLLMRRLAPAFIFRKLNARVLLESPAA